MHAWPRSGPAASACGTWPLEGCGWMRASSWWKARSKPGGWKGGWRRCSVWGDCSRRGSGEVQLAGRGRLVLPEGFREFLGVEPGGETMVVGAAVCVEIWHPERWSSYVGEEMPAFRQLLDRLSS